MVSFTSLIMISLLAVAQLAQASVLPESRAFSSYMQCDEDFGLSFDNTVEHDRLVFDDSAEHDTFIPNDSDDQSPTIIKQEERSINKGQYITTIQTWGIFNNQYVVRIDFNDLDNKTDSRFFTLTAGKKCRVRWSAKYQGIIGAVYVSQLHDDESK